MSSGQTEAVVAPAVARIVAVAVRGANVPAVVVPTAAAHHAVLAVPSTFTRLLPVSNRAADADAIALSSMTGCPPLW